MRQIHDQVMRLAFDAVDDHQRFAEVGLGVARRMRERHEHLLPTFPGNTRVLRQPAYLGAAVQAPSPRTFIALIEMV